MANVDVVALFKRVASEVERKDFSNITRDTRVTDLGVDSVTMMEIVGMMEDELGIQIPDTKLSGLQTVGDIERVVLERL